MLDVKESGLIYKFQENSLFSEACTPHNLCPYMRRFLRLFIGTFIAYAFVIIAAIGVFAAPLYAYFGNAYNALGWYFQMYTTTGWVVWLCVVGGGFIWVLNRVFSKKYASRRAMNRAAVKYIKDPVVRAVKCNVFIQWYKASHDKICPELNFVPVEDKTAAE